MLWGARTSPCNAQERTAQVGLLAVAAGRIHTEGGLAVARSKCSCKLHKDGRTCSARPTCAARTLKVSAPAHTKHLQAVMLSLSSG